MSRGPNWLGRNEVNNGLSLYSQERCAIPELIVPTLCDQASVATVRHNATVGTL